MKPSEDLQANWTIASHWNIVPLITMGPPVEAFMSHLGETRRVQFPSTLILTWQDSRCFCLERSNVGYRQSNLFVSHFAGNHAVDQGQMQYFAFSFPLAMNQSIQSWLTSTTNAMLVWWNEIVPLRYEECHYNRLDINRNHFHQEKLIGKWDSGKAFKPTFVSSSENGTWRNWTIYLDLYRSPLQM